MWLFKSKSPSSEQSKRWVLSWLALVFAAMASNAAVNYVVDPFGIFRSSFFPYQFQINERYLKIEHLKAHHQRYDTYLFGSSRIGTMQPDVVQKYLPGSSVYNFTLASGNIYEYLLHLEYFLNQGFTVKNLLIQIDIENMARYGAHDSDNLRRLHPDVTGESEYLYLAHYLVEFFPKNIRRKIRNNLERHDYLEYDLEDGGAWTRREKEERMREDCCRYVANEASFHVKRERRIRASDLEETVAAVKRIRKLCRDNGINLYLFTMAQNAHTMDTFKVDAYLAFLGALAKTGSYFDFSGYNSVTTNDCNYYEWSHYRPKVARWIAARIFHDSSVDVPNDFGVWVTRENIERHFLEQKQAMQCYQKGGTCHPMPELVAISKQ